MKQVGLCFQRRWSFTVMMRIYWCDNSPNIYPVMISKEIHLFKHLLSFLYLCVSHGYNGAFTAFKVVLKPVNNQLGRHTSYSWMVIPTTVVFNVLAIDLLSSQEFSVSDEANRGRRRCEGLDVEEYLYDCSHQIKWQLGRGLSLSFVWKAVVLKVFAVLYFFASKGSFQLRKQPWILYLRFDRLM